MEFFIVPLVFVNFGRNSITIITALFLEDPTGFNANGVEIALYSNVRSIANMVAGLVDGKTDDNRVMAIGITFFIVGISWLIVAPTFLFSRSDTRSGMV